MTSVLNWLKTLFKPVAAVVDAVIPVAPGKRTQIAVLVGAAATGVCLVYPPACAIVPTVTYVLTFLTPVLAAAELGK